MNEVGATGREVMGLGAMAIGVVLLVASVIEAGWWSVGILAAEVLVSFGVAGMFHPDPVSPKPDDEGV